ncbi:MAG TPA: calcium/proton exchanger [Gemmatimonadales bacterium]|nr:calcium/proton exchanger [Gemmatimonadales bacterium]
MRLTPSPNWLLLFVPVSIALEHSERTSPAVVFFAAALAIIPTAKLIVQATEHIAVRTGSAIGGLLNATFGNLPELIIATVALRSGLLEMVRASIIGAILANLLMALGVALFLGGIRYHNQEFNPRAARLYSSMMLLAVISLAGPGAFERVFSAAEHLPQVHAINVRLALMLMAVYALYLYFMLGTHRDEFSGESEDGHGHHPEGPHWSMPRALGTLIGASVLAAWMSEILVGAAEGTGEELGMSQTFIGMIVVAVVGGAAESLSAIAAGAKNKLDLTMGVVYGACIQIALFVAPVLVLLSRWIAPEPLDLSFSRIELGVLLLAVLIGGSVGNDGRGNWFKGVQLLTVYATIALLLYFVPA